PPEKCYYEEVTDEPGIVVNTYGKGVTAAFPWPIGALYYRYSSEPHIGLVRDTIANSLGVTSQVETDASAMVMFTLNEQPESGRTLLHLINSSGHHGTAFHAPVPMQDIKVTIEVGRPVN